MMDYHPTNFGSQYCMKCCEATIQSVSIIIPLSASIKQGLNYSRASLGSGSIDCRVKFKLFEIDWSKKQISRTLKYLKWLFSMCYSAKWIFTTKIQWKMLNREAHHIAIPKYNSWRRLCLFVYRLEAEMDIYSEHIVCTQTESIIVQNFC